MTNPTTYTKPLIDLAGRLDFSIRNARVDIAQETIKQMRIKLNQIQKFLNDHEVID